MMKPSFSLSFKLDCQNKFNSAASEYTTLLVDNVIIVTQTIMSQGLVAFIIKNFTQKTRKTLQEHYIRECHHLLYWNLYSSPMLFLRYGGS